ncbi:hypothetical protein B0O79_2424 [Flavobacteriaceae bacterium MAR_2009_75]|nr:hypothetical protein B0O79_2424 [Flavobacteriaceae bacterium MAR_2009_75]
MLDKLTDYLKLKPRTVCLSELDRLYEETISSLAKDIRTAYCQRLIERTRYDLEKIKDNEKRKPVEQLLMAAEWEICNLSAQ